MHVRFTKTLDDMVDAHLREGSRSRLAQSWHWEGFVSIAILAGPLLLAIAIEPRPARVGIAILALALYASTLRRVGDWYYLRILRKHYQEHMGEDVPFEVTVELSPSGVSLRQVGQRVEYGWSNIEKVLETPDSIDFYERYGNILVVRKRAFDSADAQRQFVELAERYRAEAH